MTEQEKLAKANSIAHHLGKMSKAIHSFHDHMTKLHKAHADDMNKAMGHLHKMVGIEPQEQKQYGGGNNEPVSTDLRGSGTHNLQDFGASGSDDAAKALKSVQDQLAKAQVDLEKAKKGICPECDKQMADCKCAAKATDAQGLTKADVHAAMNEFMENFMKALNAEDTSPTQAIVSVVDPNQVQQNNSGVGDRRQIPVQRVTGAPVGKAVDGMNVVDTTEKPLTVELARSALNGDRTAIREFMKSAKAGDVPDTLVAPLAKIH